MGGAEQVSGRDIVSGALALFFEIVLSFVIAIFVKKLYGDFSVFAILFFRYLFCLPLLFAYGWYRRGRDLLQINNIPGLIRRSISGLAGLSTWFVAIGMIDISLATALSQTMPIFITILAPIILGEIVGIRRFAAVVAGFVGVIILLGPVDFSAAGYGVVFALASPLVTALMFIYLRVLGQSEAPVSTALWYNMFGLVFAFTVGCFDGSMTGLYAGVTAGSIGADILLMLIAIGVLSSFQQLLMALSHTFAPASVLAPVHYSAIPLGVITGIVFFGEEISFTFILGVAIILAANYYILIRERVRRKS